MDTHIASHATVDPEIAPLSARLPGEREDGSPEHAKAPPFGLGADAGTDANTGPAVGGAGEGSVGAADAIAGGGDGPAAPEPDEHLPRSDASRPKRRHALLLGVAVVALLAAGGSVFLISPYNHVYPVPRMASTVRHLAASAGIKLPPLLAPSASLASVSLPPAPAPVVHQRYTPKPKDQEIQELLALHADGPAAPTAAAHPERLAQAQGPARPADRHDEARPPAGYVAHEPGSETPPVRTAATGSTPAAPSPTPPAHPASGTATVAQAPPAPTHERQLPSAAGATGAASAPHDVTGAILSSLRPSSTAGTTPSGAASVHPSAPHSATAPALKSTADAVTIAHELRPAPMTPKDQIQVLNLVTEMATMLREVRTQDAQLRADFSKSSADTAARLSDFERRLTLAEARNAMSDARNAVAAAATSGGAVDGANPTTTRNSPPAKTIPVRLTTAAAALPGGGSELAKRYRVQAASPGLALLAEVDRGGDGAQLQVIVGDNIPGYGRVKSIAQRGTSWVVTTEQGAIQ